MMTWRRRATWTNLLCGVGLGWAGVGSLAAAVRLYETDRFPAAARLALLAEAGLLTGSAALIGLAVAEFLRAGEAGPTRRSGRLFRRLGLVSFLVLAWCFGTLR
jgi:hypothetical protein